MVKGEDMVEADTDSTTCTEREAEVESSEEDRAIRGGTAEHETRDVQEVEKAGEGDERALPSEDDTALLQSYGRRFAEMRQGDIRPLARQAFPWKLKEDAEEPAGKQVTHQSLRAELELDLGLKVGALDPDQCWVEESQCTAGLPQGAANPQPKKLSLTFGYAGNLDKSPPYARFDVRDHICLRVGGFRHGQVVRDESGAEFIVVGVKRTEGTPRLWFQPRSLRRPAAGAFPGASAADLRARLFPVQKISQANMRQRLSVRLREASLKEFNTAEGSDGEEVLLCQHCHLPVGDFAYAGGGKQGALVHGECMAQRMLRDFKEEEECNNQDEAALKKMRRTDYDIGWKVERIPCNAGLVERLGCSPAPQGMCCLVLDSASNAVHVAPTVEPAASINLEYLSLALQVRLREGREPMFSLDPVEPSRPGTMQFKRFEPQWLAGTSAGEVLFQADYHLKELSMGEYEQPVLGMKSCFDFSEEGHEKEWSAREWFVVNKAEVQQSEDDVLIPYVRMGVQAREQILGADGCLEDCELTRHDHPLVKYAEAFTRNFDLIAERKSVIFHLRELAKATILAKFLIEADVWMDEAWLSLAGEGALCCMEVPQLWNERCHSQIRMQDGAIVNEKRGFGSRVHSVYGGVDFGLGRFRLAAAQRPSGVLQMAMSTPPHVRAHTLGVPPGFEPTKVRGVPVLRPAIFHPRPALPAAPVEARPVVAPPVTRPGPPPRAAVPPRAAPPPVRAARPARPVRAARPARPAAGVEARGVDLNLDEFNLSAPVPLPAEAAGSWGANVRSQCARGSIGAAFWSSISDGSEAVFKHEDAGLLRDIFNPHLSDRRNEGSLFVPPDTSFSYLEKLRGLVRQEWVLRQHRKDHFFSTKFVMEDAGPLFPSSWRPAFEIARGRTPVRPAGESLQAGLLRARPDYAAEARVFEHMLKAASPVFDRSTEDGTRFRIYRFGSLEVRTTEEHGGGEAVGAVFSIRVSARGSPDGAEPERRVQGHERVVKVTEYAERAMDGHCRSYVVLETDQANVVATERLADGTVTWEENSQDLEDRNSLAKVIRSASRLTSRVAIQDMGEYRSKELRQADCGASPSKCKRYAQGAYSRAIDTPGRIVPGFRRQTKSDSWKLGKDLLGDSQETRASNCTDKRALRRDSMKKYAELQGSMGFSEQARYFKVKPVGARVRGVRSSQGAIAETM